MRAAQKLQDRTQFAHALRPIDSKRRSDGTHGPEPLGESAYIAAGTPIHFEGDEATCLYRLLSGTVVTYSVQEDGRRQVTGFRFAGDFFGCDSSPLYRATAEAITDCTIVRYSRRKLNLFNGASQYGHFVLQAALGELRAAEEQILLLGRTTSCAKVAAFLLYLAQRARQRGAAGKAVSIPMTRYDIGGFLGLTAESVSRCFTKLKSAGLIELETFDEVVLVDEEALSDIPRGF